MAEKIVDKILEERDRKQKAKLGLYLTPNMVFSYNGFSNFVFTAVRGVGKSVISVETAIILKRKYGVANWWKNFKDIQAIQ